jgi:hypothetical protein
MRQVFRVLMMIGVTTLLVERVEAQNVAAPSVDAQVAAAVLALPEEFRATATVLGYRGTSGTLETIRRGDGAMICLGDNPNEARFHVACYHKDLEPFMARGRELRAQGVSGAQVDSVRFREVREQKLAMPAMGTLYSVTTKKENYDAATNKLTGAPGLLAVIYVPNATPASTGITAQPRQDGPWLMFPGTLKAHIMMVGTMSP